MHSKSALAFTLTVSLILAGDALPLPRAAQVPTWLPNDGQTGQLVASPGGDRIYVAGSFKLLGPPVGGGVLLDPAGGARVGTQPVFDGDVNAAVADGSGGFYVGGAFEHVSGVPATGLVHVLANGGVDQRFKPQITGPGGCRPGCRGRPLLGMLGGSSSAVAVDALALAPGRLYVTGDFRVVGGSRRNGLAALDPRTGTVLSWTAGLKGGAFTTVLPAGPVVFLASGTASPHVAELAAVSAASGAILWRALASMGPGYGGKYDEEPSVDALAESHATLYVGGDFLRIGGASRDSIAALDATTGTVEGWAPRLGPFHCATVTDLLLTEGRLFLADEGEPCLYSGLVSADLRTARLTQVSPPRDQSDGWSLTLIGGTVYVGGAESSSTNLAGWLAAYDTRTLAPVEWPVARLNSSVTAMAASGSRLFVGGLFQTIGGVPRCGLAAVDAASGVPTGWNPEAAVEPECRHGGPPAFDGPGPIAIDGDTVYVTEPEQGRVVAVSATTGAPLPWSVTFSDTNPTSLVATSGEVLIGANDGVTAFDDTTGRELWTRPITGLDQGHPVYPLGLAVSGQAVYVAGDFTAIGGVQRGGLAAVGIQSGTVLPWNPAAGARVWTAIAASGPTVYVSEVRGYSPSNRTSTLSAFDASTGTPQWSVAVHGNVASLATTATTLFAGGFFKSIGGRARTAIAALNPVTGDVLGWDAGIQSDQANVDSILPTPGRVYLSGFFLDAGGVPSPGFAALTYP
jgi:outer membrane protein assembly factor BamB